MRITGVWNPLFELPDSPQILQEKVRYYVTWGYEKARLSAWLFRSLVSPPLAGEESPCAPSVASLRFCFHGIGLYGGYSAKKHFVSTKMILLVETRRSRWCAHQTFATQKLLVRKTGHFTHDTLQNRPFVRKTGHSTHERCANVAGLRRSRWCAQWP